MIKFNDDEKGSFQSHIYSYGQSQIISSPDKFFGCGIERALESIVISVLEKKKKQKRNRHTF